MVHNVFLLRVMRAKLAPGAVAAVAQKDAARGAGGSTQLRDAALHGASLRI